MPGSRISRCSYCRFLVNYVRKQSLLPSNTQRGLSHVLSVHPGRPLSTTPRYYKNTDDGNITSSSSSDDSGSDSSSDSDSDHKKSERVSEPVRVSSLLSRMTKSGVVKSESSADKISDILSKLAKPSQRKKIATANVTETTDSMRNKEEAESSSEQDSNIETDVRAAKKALNSKMVSATKQVASVLPGKDEEIQSKLLGQLLRQSSGLGPKQTEDDSDANLSTLLKGFQSLNEQASKEMAKETKDSRIRERRQYKGDPRQRQGGQRQQDDWDYNMDDATSDGKDEKLPESVILKGKPLNIMLKQSEATQQEPERKSLFDIVEEEERLKHTKYPPRNAFEEHIKWTKEGKLWTFPIDNDAGWKEEENVSFQDHVFLDRHLVGFPTQGPVRHFMELVTTALAKNPYLTVAQKREHIDWYREYFMGKQEILTTHLGDDGQVLEV